MAVRVPAARGWLKRLRSRGPRAAGSRLPRPRRPRATRLLLILGVLGPGLIAANAGNDAGGIATYSAVGAKYGYQLLWLLVLITISLATVQALAARMGAVTGKGLAELVRERYGVRWSVLSTVAVLCANLGICISEFVGIGAALGLAGIPAQISVPIAAVMIWLIIARGSYRTAERIFIWLTIPFFAYPVAAILAQPDWAQVAQGFVPSIEHNRTYLLLVIATAGTTITPYMQLYLQSAVVERRHGEEEVEAVTREAVAGAVFADVIAGFIIIATAATLFTHGVHEIGSAAEAAGALAPFAGQYAEALFGIGLLGASLLAAAILPIATAYVVAESLGFEKGLSHRPSEARTFVGVITAMIAIATVVAVIPGVPVIQLLIGVQVINGLLLPITLFFIWSLARNRELMGRHRNRGAFDILTGVTVAATSLLSVGLVVITVVGL